MHCLGPRSNVTLRWSACAGPRFRLPRLRRGGLLYRKRGARGIFQCNACRKQTSVKAGTIFTSSKVPLGLWFKAIYHMTR